jgi:hypothetical protein
MPLSQAAKRGSIELAAGGRRQDAGNEGRGKSDRRSPNERDCTIGKERMTGIER